MRSILAVGGIVIAILLGNSSQASDRRDLIRAISKLDALGVENLLQDPARREKVGFRKQTYSGNTPLTLAVYQGDLGVVGALLEAAPDPDSQKMKDGSTPLMIAAAQGDRRMVELLLAQGSDPSFARRSDQVTAFFLAAQEDHRRVMEELVRSGRLNYKKEIQVALKFGRKDVAQKLLADFPSPQVSSDRASSSETPASLLKILEDPTCAICLDTPESDDRAVVTACGHCYCQSCLNTYFTTRNTRKCPMCRAFVPKDQIFSPGQPVEPMKSGMQVNRPGNNWDQLDEQARPEGFEPAEFERVTDRPDIAKYLAPSRGDKLWKAGNLFVGSVVKREGRIVEMNHQEAAEYCASLGGSFWFWRNKPIGARLPTQQEVLGWDKDTYVQLHDFRAIWLADLNPKNPRSAYLFSPRFPGSLSQSIMEWPFRCVLPFE